MAIVAKANSTPSIARRADSDLTPEGVAEDINPLHYAAAMGDKKTLAALLQQKGSDANSRDAYARTALVYAVVSGKQACAEALIKSGTDVNAVDSVRKVRHINLHAGGANSAPLGGIPPTAKNGEALAWSWGRSHCY